MNLEEDLVRIAWLGRILDRLGLKIEPYCNSIAVVDEKTKRPLYVQKTLHAGMRHANNWKPGRKDYEDLVRLAQGDQH